jgi:hypothetical protein
VKPDPAIIKVAATLLTISLFLVPAVSPGMAIAQTMNPMGKESGTSSTPPSAGSGQGPILPAGFVLEGLAGIDTSLSGSYSTTSGQTVPYDFGSAPVWAIRAGKMLFPKVLAYLTVQQSYFSRNSHTIIGLGGNYYLPQIPGTHLLPYLNATFGASYNTYTGVNAQAGYAWMLGAGALYPLSPVLGVFLEANISYETAPTGITTSLGSPPGNISQVSDTWSVPVMMGIRYAF